MVADRKSPDNREGGREGQSDRPFAQQLSGYGNMVVGSLGANTNLLHHTQMYSKYKVVVSEIISPRHILLVVL